ncbi:MAG: sulfatase-like hydrolase/transferase [Thermoanaerobaculales bacterium]|nr:sulfatase-like hydrolase/transferase [Thermoanaerobaculales bacterium]
MAHLVAWWLFAATAVAAPPPPPAPRLAMASAPGASVLLVTLDTTRADRLGCYGAPGAATPNLDRLAGRAFRFDHAVTPAPTTLPAHASLMTGLYPPTHGARANGETRLDGAALTAAEIFGRKGWRTAAFVSAFVLDARYGLDQGFEVYDDRVTATAGPTFAAGTNERDAGATTDAALEWLARLRDGERFFLWVHYFDPHAPYAPPAPFSERFAGRAYEGEIAYMDSQLGRLLDDLESSERLRKTLVVVAGDHGESLGEHGETTHGLFLYDSTLRVPLLVSLPGQDRGAVVDDRVVSLVDVLPSLLDLVGISLPLELDGRSMVAASGKPSRAVYAEALTSFLDFGWAPLHALRRLDDKVIEAPRPEYYDLASDPDESRNLWSVDEPGLATRRSGLAESLHGWRSRWPDDPGIAAAPVSTEERDRLAALGYLAGQAADAPPSPVGLADPKDRVAVSEALIAANARLAAGDPAGALEVLDAVVRVDPADRAVHYARAKALLRLDRTVEAEAALREVRRLRPKADASLLLAQILILDGRLGEAAELLDEAAALEPEHGGILIARGDLLLRLGRPDEARRAWERASTLDPYRAAGTAAARLQGLERAGVAVDR